MLRFLGGAIFLWGAADLVLSWTGMDLWAEVGVTLPEFIWQFSHYAAMALGGVIFMAGSPDQGAEETKKPE
ncbi:hypothetical protein [Actibacterium sp. 188UL27-1]|uniref:hypothetical protein n=1 Tax=Actibacterium sp. 188UL27-1 TaxID=2786961 RepID=UPI00195D780A|nr:hypothetical protein [Actibacterium sp. 188UL27-1]MBM7069833.1 hypothetical protein [Actibacterium sp. 188UL27-1]